MKKHAIKLLPKSSWLKDEAITIDMSESALPPIYRPIPVDTPPIPGFDPSDHMSKGSWGNTMVIDFELYTVCDLSVCHEYRFSYINYTCKLKMRL